jgi:hypothetical protein
MTRAWRMALALGVALLLTPTAAGAAPSWASATTATIRPGVQVESPSGRCTANFVFHDDQDVYLGQAAHCTSTGGVIGADGCTTESLPLGTPVSIQGASRPGVLAYNSWLTMQAVGEDDWGACAGNDFALVRIHPADVGKVNPSVPHWGGPTALSTGTSLGGTVYSYGNSRLRLGLTLLSPKLGVSVARANRGWTHAVYAVTPGIPGDSGSAFLDASGRALGVLSTLALVPPLANGVVNLPRALAYLHEHVSGDLQLATGTEAFTPNKLPLAL